MEGERKGSVSSSQHLIIPTRLAQLRPHKAAHRGVSLNAKDAFPVTRKCARSDGNEGVRAIAFPHEATVGGLSGDAWPVSPWLVPRAEGQEVAEGILGGYKPSSVRPHQTAIRCFIQMACEHRAL